MGGSEFLNAFMSWGIRNSESLKEGKCDGCTNVKLYVLVELDVLSLVNSTAHFFFSFQLTKTIWKHKLFQHQIPVVFGIFQNWNATF